MIILEDSISGEGESNGTINQNLNNISILCFTALIGKNYELEIKGTCLNDKVQLTICITAYYLVKLLKSFDNVQPALVEDCVSKIERGSFVEGDKYDFPVPLKLKPEVNIRVSKNYNSKTRSNINSLSNSFYAKGISKQYVKVNRQTSDTPGEAARKRIENLLVKSFALYEDYKKEGFGEFFSRKICGLDNDMLFELAKLYASEDANKNDEE